MFGSFNPLPYLCIVQRNNGSPTDWGVLNLRAVKAKPILSMTTTNNANEMNKVNFVNCTPHEVVLNDGTKFAPSGVCPRISSGYTEPDANGIATPTFGEVEGLPEPQENTLYIVSGMVLSACKDRNDLVAPATSHPKSVRFSDGPHKGQVQSVFCFVRRAD